MSIYAVVGEACDITFDGNDYRAYEFAISKAGSRIPVKAFVDGIGVNPEIVTGTGKELTAKFRDDITEVFALNTNYYIIYSMESTAVSGWYKCLDIQNTTPADGIADYTTTFKNVPLSSS